MTSQCSFSVPSEIAGVALAYPFLFGLGCELCCERSLVWFMVDTGLLRKDEAKIVKKRLEEHVEGMKLTVLDATSEFYRALAGVSEPEKKRKIIGRLFIEAFER